MRPRLVLVVLSVLSVFLIVTEETFSYQAAPCYSIYLRNLNKNYRAKDIEDCNEEFLDNVTKHVFNFEKNVPETPGVKYKNCEISNQRSFDGRCNNANFKFSGMAGLEFANMYEMAGEKIPNPKYDLLDPNPRLVSTKLLRREKFIPYPTKLNALGMAQLAFIFHDLMSHELTVNDGYIKVPIPEDDPDWPACEEEGRRRGQRYMLVPKTKGRKNPNAGGRIGYINEISSWIDGGVIYGTKEEELKEIRTFEGGRVKLDDNGYIMVDKNRKNKFGQPYAYTGDQRVFMHQGLAAMQTIWMREHNNLAKKLNEEYPWLNDEELFQKTRMILAAEIAVVHAREALSIVNQFLGLGFAESIMKDVLSGESVYENDWYSFPEPLVSAYRWHSLTVDHLDTRDYKDGTILDTFDYIDTAFDTEFLKQKGLEEVIVGLGSAYAGAFRLFNHPKKLLNFKHKFKFGHHVDDSDKCNGAVDGFDIVMMDVIRDRERSVPRYAEWRRILGLDIPTKFEDITRDEKALKMLKEVYDNDIEKVDLLVGALAEDRTPDGIEEIPPTWRIMVSAAVGALGIRDRLISDSLNQDTYTAWGLRRIIDISMNKIIYENTKIEKIPEDIFKTWQWFSTENHPSRFEEQPVIITDAAEYALGYYINNMIIAIVGFWVSGVIIDLILKSSSKTYRKDSLDNQHAVVTYVLEIIITTLTAIWVAYLGVVLLMIQEIDLVTAQQTITAGVIIFTMYIYELIYRPSMRWQLIVHHLAVIVIIMVTVSRFLYYEALNITVLQITLVLGYTALSEQPIFFALIAYRMNYRHPMWFYFAAGWNLITKLALHATALFFWGRAGGISLFWILFFIFIVICCLIPAQYYSIYVQFVIAQGLAKKKSVSSKERRDEERSGPRLKRQQSLSGVDDLDGETKEWLSARIWKSFEPTIENF